MKKTNFLFAGRFLVAWYVIFAVVVGLLIYNHQRLANIKTYTVIVYDASGAEADRREGVKRSELPMLRAQLPFTKTFIPNK